MPIMNDMKSLRLEPNGVKTNIVAMPGDEVVVLETREEWSKVRLVGVHNQPEGWVIRSSIDMAAVAVIEEIERPHFAEECVLLSLFYGISAHYLIAVGEVRSQISAANAGDEFGPFRLHRTEWDAFRTDAEFGLAFEPNAFGDWRLQASVFALMARRAQDGLMAKLDGRRPTASELYLSQLVGPAGAARALKEPAATIERIVQDLNPDDKPVGAPPGVSPVDRFAGFLKSGTKSATAQKAMENIGEAFDKALQATAEVIREAGAQILDPETSTVIEDLAPEMVLFRQPKAPNSAPVQGHLIERMQRALVATGDMAEFDEQGRRNVDGEFGRRTSEALKSWQGKQQFGVTGAITVAQWRTLLKEPPPDIYERSAQLTASFEGTGFGGVNKTDFDNTILTFGYHGYTITGGNLQKFIKEFATEFPDLFDRAFADGKAAELRQLVSLPKAQLANRARAMFLVGSQVKPDWLAAFRAFGLIEECKNKQIEFSRKSYWEPGLRMGEALGLSEPLSLATCFDVAVQNGSKLAVAKSVARTFKPGMSEQDKRLAFAEKIVASANAVFARDVEQRKVDTLVDGVGIVHEAHYDLSDWGFSSAESAELDQPANVAPVSENSTFSNWFEQNVPNSLIPAQAFLYKGGAHQRNHLNSDPPRALWPNVIKLAMVISELKRRLGNPRIELTSIYRNRRYNESVGGARASVHMSFKAADIIVHDGRGPRQWAAMLKAMRREGVFAGGIGIYNTFCHVDTRGHNADW